MKPVIYEMTEKDKPEVMEMMRVFYASEAVLSNGSDEIFENDIDACAGESPFAEGFVFKDGAEYLGYAMLAHSFSTEFGRPCVWIEDLYLKPKYRGKGIGKAFFDMISDRYTGAVYRLEVERENETAMHLYRKSGFEIIPYDEMIKK